MQPITTIATTTTKIPAQIPAIRLESVLVSCTQPDRSPHQSMPSQLWTENGIHLWLSHWYSPCRHPRTKKTKTELSVLKRVNLSHSLVASVTGGGKIGHSGAHTSYPALYFPGPEVIKLFSCSTQLSMKFFLLINVEMPKIVGISTFMSMKNYILI